MSSKMSFFDTSFCVILPNSHSNFFTEWQSCLEQLTALSKKSLYRIFKISIFISSSDSKDFRTRKRFITEAILNTFGDDCPAFGVLAISPEEQFHATIEAGIVKSSYADLYYKKYKDVPYSVLVNNRHKELWVNGIETKSAAPGTENASRRAFDIMHQILSRENMTFDNIIRQWNYIGKILNTGQTDSELTQNYQIFNKVRFDYYNKFRQITGYPAATGVGMNYSGVVIDFLAVEPSEGMEIISIGNPQQKNPYDYDQIVLAESSSAIKEEKHPPLFERAILLADQSNWQLFISGTASIMGQETTAVGNLHEQTRITIENIMKLTSTENIQAYYPQIVSSKPFIYTHIRVYIKNSGDIPEVKTICTEYFGNIPSVYIQSHICRTNLLVEIEAEVSS